MKILKMTIVIINSIVVCKGFLKRQCSIIDLRNSYIVADYLDSNGNQTTIPFKIFHWLVS